MTRDPRVPHIRVSLLVAALAGLDTLLMATLTIWIAVPLLAVISLAYIVLPRVSAHRVEAASPRPSGADG